MRESLKKLWNHPDKEELVRDFIRGIPTGGAKTLQEWETWETDARAQKPVRVFLADDLWQFTILVAQWPTRRVRRLYRWFYNRFYRRSYRMTSSLPKKWRHEFETRVLHCVFDTFCEEMERSDLQYMRWIASKKDRIDDRHERQLVDLYDWWTKTRPARPDPSAVSGVDDMNQRRHDDPGSVTETERSDAYRMLFKVEEDYQKEDDEMLLKLIELRSFVGD